MSGDADVIALAEKVLAILELGSFSTTYKYALFSAILDLCLEKFSDQGVPPDSLSTRQLAEKVIEQYWPHAVPYEGQGVLRQSAGRGDAQAEIVSAIVAYRERHPTDSGEPLFRARQSPDFEKLVRRVEWKLVEMPIPRLQVVGRDEDRFLYEYEWDKDVSPRAVAAYQRGEPSDFDNLLRLRPGVAEGLVRLTGVLRPIVKREWAAMVARMNRLHEATLDTFLFGAERVPLGAVHGPLVSLHENRCFYCDERLGAHSEVDHFIPWARYPDNSLDNLVVAHERCNNQKRDFLAAAEHVERWWQRRLVHDADLAEIAAETGWERDSSRSRSVALALYTRMPDGARLWLRGDELVPIDQDRVRQALVV